MSKMLFAKRIIKWLSERIAKWFVKWFGGKIFIRWLVPYAIFFAAVCIWFWDQHESILGIASAAYWGIYGLAEGDFKDHVESLLEIKDTVEHRHDSGGVASEEDLKQFRRNSTQEQEDKKTQHTDQNRHDSGGTASEKDISTFKR